MFAAMLRPVYRYKEPGVRMLVDLISPSTVMGIQFWTHSGRNSLISLLLFMACFACVDAVNLIKCGKSLQTARGGSWNTTNGTPPHPDLRVSREECIAECGVGIGDVSWQTFSQGFGAWFLPWIALMFQIPFGGEYPLEDVLNFFMTIGSPALAAYSLQITHLNAGWLSRAFLDLEYPNSRAISTVLSTFQHVPIRISPTNCLLPSLIVLPQNDAYWELLLKGAKKSRRWSIPLVVGFAWVVVATLLTIIDSFCSPPPTGEVGYAIVATWAYLLPLIMGWLHVGSQPTPNHLRECLSSANQIAWVATDTKNRPIRAKDVAGRQTQAIEFMRRDNVDRARMDELRAVPVFNYARAFIWSLHAQQVLSLARSAAAKAERRIPVDNYGPGRGTAWVASDNWSVANENRIGTEEQVIRYCTETFAPSEEVSGAPSIATPPGSEPLRTPNTSIALLPLYNPGREVSRKQSRWAPGIWRRAILAVFFALGLQWGTIGAAVVIHYWKPPVGLGCRSLAFLLYGIAATLSMFLCLAATILAHISRPQHGPVHWLSWSQRWLDWGAVFCGYLGKGLTLASGIGIILICSFQSSGAFTDCYCSSTTIDKGVYDVAFPTINYVIRPDIVGVWIGGLVLAFSAAVLFGFSLYLGTPPRR